MEPLIIPNARGRFISLLVMDIVLLIASLLLLAQPQVRATPSAWLGRLATLLLLVGIPVLLWQVLDSRPYLIVDERGVWYRPFGLGFIPWPSITDILLKPVVGTTIICLELDHPEQWLARLSFARRAVARLNQAMGFPAFSLNFSRIGARPQMVFDHLQQFHSHSLLPISATPSKRIGDS
jgi:hypothetical protein